MTAALDFLAIARSSSILDSRLLMFRWIRWSPRLLKTFQLSIELDVPKSIFVCSSEGASLSSKKSSAKVNWCQILSKWSIGLFWQGLHVGKEPMRGFSNWLHLLWIHRPHFSHEISLFLTGLAHTEHGYCTGPGCKFMSPDSINRHLKY